MSNSQQMKKGLSVRDLITTGILAALYMVCAMIGEAIFGFFPVLTFLCPLSIALLCGPVYMLILAKVPKHGPIIVTGILVHKKDTADYSDYIRNGGEQDADRFYTGRARIRGCFFLSA